VPIPTFTSNHVVEELFSVHLMLFKFTLEGVDGGGIQFIVTKEDGGGRAGMEGFNQDRMHGWLLGQTGEFLRGERAIEISRVIRRRGGYLQQYFPTVLKRSNTGKRIGKRLFVRSSSKTSASLVYIRISIMSSRWSMHL
jgi:hypothetical protein